MQVKRWLYLTTYIPQFRVISKLLLRMREQTFLISLIRISYKNTVHFAAARPVGQREKYPTAVAVLVFEYVYRNSLL